MNKSIERRNRDPVSVLLRLLERNYQKLNDAREIFEVISSRMVLLDNPQELIAFLGQHLKPKELEKKQHGEVFTPPELIQQKFDKLTALDPSIWSDPNKKFLDPANGIGNYPSLAYDRLMEGLKEVIPNEAKRKKHILENMLYMCELNKKNVEVSRKLFDPKNQYKLHIFQGSFFDLDIKKEWATEKFDVIFGNPPYNSPGKGASGNTLWHLFLKDTLQLVKENGYIVFVHPPGWRKPNTDKGKFNGLFKRLTVDNQLLYLEMNNIEKGKEVFRCGTRYDWYIMKACKPWKQTEVKDENGSLHQLDLKPFPWCPSSNIDIMKKILRSNGEEGCQIMQSMSAYEPRKKWMSKTKTGAFQHPCIHATNKTGVRYMYSNTNNNGHFGISKVIFGDSGITNPVIDMKGEFGMTQHAMGIQVSSEEEANLVRQALMSKKFKLFLKSCMWSTFGIEWNMFTDFKRTFYKEFVDEDEETVSETASVTSSLPDYKKMKVGELRDLCKERNIKGISGKKKEELIALLTA
jgi:hypothetical protein